MLQLLIIPILVFIDQIVKSICVEKLVEPITLIPGIIELLYVENRGAAFGIMQDKRIFLVGLPILIIIGLLIYLFRLGDTLADKFTKISLILIISGAIGNLIDRVVNGYVVDMFHFTFFEFPVFNIADILVVIGTIILILTTIFMEEGK